MGQKKRTEIRLKQLVKRKRRRARLAKKGKNPDDSFSSGVFVSRRLK
jgi:hypothetical protein